MHCLHEHPQHRDALEPPGPGPTVHTYNHHRSHTALGGLPPITRVNNAAGQYI